MKTPWQRIRTGLTLAGFVIIVSYAGYVLAGYDWVEALWILAVTLSTVGYSETSNSHPGFQLFTVGVIIFGLTAVAYTFGGLIQMMIEGEFQRTLGKRRQLEHLRQLRDHIVLCGFGRTGQLIAEDLTKTRQPFVVIELDEKLAAEAGDIHHYLCLEGDATQDDLLMEAGVERCKAVISALSNDAANVFITLTAREMNPDVFIVARAENLSTERKLRAAGANRVVMPARIGAHIMERLVTRPHTADFLELIAESSFSDVEMDEVKVAKSSPIAGKRLSELSIFREHRLLVVGVRLPNGEMIFNPTTKHLFEEDQILIVMGHPEDIRQFRHRMGIVYHESGRSVEEGLAGE